MPSLSLSLTGLLYLIHEWTVGSQTGAMNSKACLAADSSGRCIRQSRQSQHQDTQPGSLDLSQHLLHPSSPSQANLFQPQRRFSTTQVMERVERQEQKGAATSPGLLTVHRAHAYVSTGIEGSVASTSALMGPACQRQVFSHLHPDSTQGTPSEELSQCGPEDEFSTDSSAARPMTPSAHHHHAADTPQDSANDSATLDPIHGPEALAARQLHLRALSHLHRKQWKVAADLLRQAMLLHESEPQLHHSLAKALLHQGLWHEALQHASTAVDLQPDRRSHLVLRACCRSRAGFHDLALSEFEALCGPPSPSSPGLTAAETTRGMTFQESMAHASALYRAGHMRAASAKFHAISATAPHDAVSHSRIIDVHMRLREFQETYQNIRHFLKKWPGNAAMHIKGAHALILMGGQQEQAAAELDAAQRLLTAPAAHLQSTIDAMRQQVEGHAPPQSDPTNSTRAAAGVKSVMDSSQLPSLPPNFGPLTACQAASAMAKHGGAVGLQQGLVILDAEIQHHPKAIAPRRLQAQLQHINGDVPAAKNSLAAALQLQPHDAGLARTRAKFDRSSRRTGDSIMELTAALEASPGNPALLHLSAKALADLGRPDLAIDALDAALQTSPSFHEARILKARLLRRQDRLYEALRESQQVLDIVVTGMSAAKQKDQHHQSSPVFPVHANGRHWCRALHEQGKTLMVMQRYEEALSCLQQLLMQQARNCGALLDLARCHSGLGQSQEALAACDRAKQLVEATLRPGRASADLAPAQCIRTLQGIADIQAATGNTAEAQELLGSLLSSRLYPLTARDSKRVQRRVFMRHDPSIRIALAIHHMLTSLNQQSSPGQSPADERIFGGPACRRWPPLSSLHSGVQANSDMGSGRQGPAGLHDAGMTMPVLAVVGISDMLHLGLCSTTAMSQQPIYFGRQFLFGRHVPPPEIHGELSKND
ncbi:hypothetical protein WJX74_000866 [Apatococcus lobatus]|uniref:Uncharacterized protein n=1 Tax=Apatococcus lobatus TaxID=904363 RepID=A0AAW1QCT3_9CHLO